MELSVRMDALGRVEMRFLRGQERFRDWPPFLLLAGSGQARVFAYMSRAAAEQLHAQIIAVEVATGLDEDEDEQLEADRSGPTDQEEANTRDGDSAFSPSLAQALEKLNELARQHLPEGATSPGQAVGSPALGGYEPFPPDEESLLEQLQEAFVQIMGVLTELAEDLSSDALKLTTRFRCARSVVEFLPMEKLAVEDVEGSAGGAEAGEIDLAVELALVLQLFEEGRDRHDDLPAAELQLDVGDLEHLHETLDYALQRDRRGRRRRR